MPKDVQEQIDALRDEIRGLGDSFIDLRKDDLRQVFCGQVKPVLMEKVDRYFSSPHANAVVPQRRDAEKKMLTDLIHDVLFLHGKGEDPGANERLKGLESDIREMREQPDVEFQAFAQEVIEQLRTYLDISLGFIHQNHRNISVSRKSLPRDRDDTSFPDKVEELLSPLCNALRVRILMVLEKERMGLAELGRELGLEKGHIQFHLKALVSPGYIVYDKKSHLYSITAKGAAALGLASQMVERLS
jgi:DNA-binding HxlR family transcriptional regulator